MEPPTEPPVEPPTEPMKPPVPEKPSTEYVGSLYTRGQLASMSRKNRTYGPGQSKDSKNRPRGALDLQKKYGKYDTHFIGPDDGNIYLTFDLGWEYRGLTNVILDTLKEKNVKAVFFVVKSYCAHNPDIIRRIIDEGHVLANHSYHHTTLAELSIDGIVEEIMDLHNYVLDKFGYEMTLFRPPSGEYSEQVLAIAQSLGYTTVQWSYAYVDWEVDNQPDVDKSYKRLMKAAHSGCIYLLHAVSTTNASLLGDLIDGLRGEGYGFGLFGENA